MEKFIRAIEGVSPDAPEGAMVASGFIPFRGPKGSLNIQPGKTDRVVMVGMERPDRDASVVIEAAWAYGATEVMFRHASDANADEAWMGSEAGIARVVFPE
jgi:hypothetical protein